MTPRRILFLNSIGVIGGQEVVLLDMVRGLDRARYEPVVAALAPGELLETLRAEGVSTHVLPPHRMRQAHRLAHAVLALGLLLRRERIDLLHCNGDSLLFYGTTAGAPLGVPSVWHVYEPVNQGGNAFVRFFYETQRLMHPAWTIFGTAAVEESYVRDYPRLGERSPIMPGVDVAAITRDADGGAARRRLGVPEHAPLLLVIGRLQRSKGQRDAVEALAGLGSLEPAPHLVLCGGPPLGTDEDYPEELRALVRSLGLGGRVHFTGAVSEAEKHDLLAAATALVHPARKEAFGIVVIEGMAAQKPVIVTECVGPLSIVEGSGAAEVVPREDVAALAAAMARVLGDPERARRMGESAQAHVHARYGKAQMVKRVEAVYDAVLGARAPRSARG